jgi:hypothetical protein
MKVELFKKLIKEAVREVLVEELQFLRTKSENKTLKEEVITTPTLTSTSNNPLHDVLMITKKELSSKDYSNLVVNESVVYDQTTPNIDTNVGLDINSLDFVKNAKKIYNLSVEKSKIR